MSKKLINGEYFEDRNCYLYPILGFDDYRITDNGNVYRIIKPNTGDNWEGPDEVELVEKVISNGHPSCEMVNNKGKLFTCPIAKLLLSSRIGDLNLPIGFLDNDYLSVRLKNIFYIFTQDDIIRDEEKCNVLFIRNRDNGYLNEFREDPQSPGYFISNEGAVYSSLTNQLLQRAMGYSKSNVYYRVSNISTYREDGSIKSSSPFIHRLVYRAWKGPLNGLVIDHLNMKKYDNRVENLEAVTSVENSRRAHEVYASTNAGVNCAVYCKQDVEDICMITEAGGDIQDCLDYLANKGRHFEYKNLKPFIANLRNGSTRTDITYKYDLHKNDDLRDKRWLIHYREKIINNPDKYMYGASNVDKPKALEYLRKVARGEMIPKHAGLEYGNLSQFLKILKGYRFYQSIYQDDPEIKNYIENIYPQHYTSYINDTAK